MTPGALRFLLLSNLPSLICNLIWSLYLALIFALIMTRTLIDLVNLFGSHAFEIRARLGLIDYLGKNQWVWAPSGRSHKIASNVYHFLISSIHISSCWAGWRKLWHLRVMPRVKHFLWLLLNGKITTAEFLYSINLGPRRMCIFCDLTYESCKHLFCQCCKVQGLWNHISTLISKHISFPYGFISSGWLSHSHLSSRYKALIALTAWNVWKARCDAIFRDTKPNFVHIAHKAISQANVMNYVGNSVCWKILINNFCNLDGHFLFAASVWNVST